MKDRNRIINEMVASATDVMEAKAQEMELIAQQFDAKGDVGRAEFFREDVREIREAVKLMRKLDGCWA